MTASYDKVASSYDFLKSGDTRRWREAQKEFFKGLRGHVLYVGIGTGQEIVHFPKPSEAKNGDPGITDITAIDISREMISRSEGRISAYGGPFRRMLMNVERLAFRDNSFDSVLTVCVFCTVADPVEGFREIRRVLKPGGRVFSFEHVMSGNPFYGAVLKTMTQMTRRLSGTHLDRDTAGNLRRAGLEIVSDQNIYLDVVKAIISRKTG